MIFSALFLVLLVTAILICMSRLSLMTLFSIDSNGIHLEIKVMFYKLLTLFSWKLDEDGLGFLLKKKKDVPVNKKREKGRVSSVINMIFSRDTYDHLKKNMEVFDFSVKGRLSTKDAAHTAMIFGGVWAVIGLLIPFIPQKRLILDFYPDFQKETPDFHISCILRVRIIHIIVLIVNHFRKNIRKGRSETYGTASD
ncbi:MAG: DUF2953 domain-containing protein [Clostridiaceae bacterium]|mgnify:CR=1 FL=1|jgi:hypothetical protein|nr:DUF2953 domain-containing protein [Clostridiaceae bacterium]